MSEFGRAMSAFCESVTGLCRCKTRGQIGVCCREHYWADGIRAALKAAHREPVNTEQVKELTP